MHKFSAMRIPEKCESIDEIRAAIDSIDNEIIRLLGKRFTYVKEIVKFKDKDKDSIIARERYNEVLENRRKLAIKNGLNPDLIEEIYRRLIDFFINKEIEIAENSDYEKE